MFDKCNSGGTKGNDAVGPTSDQGAIEPPFCINDLDMRTYQNAADSHNRTKANISAGYGQLEINPYDFQRDPENLRRDPYDLQHRSYSSQPDPYAWRKTESLNGW